MKSALKKSGLVNGVVHVWVMGGRASLVLGSDFKSYRWTGNEVNTPPLFQPYVAVPFFLEKIALGGTSVLLVEHDQKRKRRQLHLLVVGE
ncbi:MAG: hypothetical protein M1357_02780 [Candidatus Marsarchaeota archaeon]|nr:hypothetical protein [Candidatus Marsarchaeota archaeon]